MANAKNCIDKLCEFYEGGIKSFENISRECVKDFDTPIMYHSNNYLLLKNKYDFLKSIRVFLENVNYKEYTFIEANIVNSNGFNQTAKVVRELVNYTDGNKSRILVLNPSVLSDKDYILNLSLFIDACCELNPNFKPDRIIFADVKVETDEEGNTTSETYDTIYKIYSGDKGWYLEEIQTSKLF